MIGQPDDSAEPWVSRRRLCVKTAEHASSAHVASRQGGSRLGGGNRDGRTRRALDLSDAADWAYCCHLIDSMDDLADGL